MIFIKTNPHPKGKKIGDCVVRACAIATTQKWIDTYIELCEIGKSIYEMPNSKSVYETFLIKHGFVKQRMPKHDNGKRYTLKQLADTNKGITVVSIAKHIATLENDRLLDTWDCSHKCVGNYFTK